MEDLRTVSLAESGALQLQREAVAMEELIDEAVAAARAAAEGAGVDLRTEVREHLPLVEVDASRIRSVLSNLLANAIRHTPVGGGVSVVAWRDQEALVVEVQDTGAGIPAELLPRVFERFVKGAGATGTGLGLAIAKDLVEAHGGTIVADSPPLGGTVISFRLPLGRAPAARDR